MPGVRNPLMINGVPVVTAPAAIDLTNVEQQRVLLKSSGGRQATAAVDMTGTGVCDPAGFGSPGRQV